MDIYETLVQRRASQTRPVVIEIWTFWKIAPNALLLPYHDETSISHCATFTFTLHLLLFLFDITSREVSRTIVLDWSTDHRCRT